MTSIMLRSTRTQPTAKVVEEASTIAKQFRPVIFLLSATGPYGIGVSKPSDEKQEINYEARKLSWKRPRSMYTLILLVWIVFCVCILTFNVALDIPFPIDLIALRSPGNASGEVTLSLSTNLILQCTVGFCRLFEFIDHFFRAALLAKWLNELTAFEIDFNNHFRRLDLRMNVNITRLRNYLAAFYVIGPGAFWMVAYLWAFLPQYQFNRNYSALGYIWFISIIFYGMVSELIEDTKMILMLVTLRRIYSQVRGGIRHEANTEDVKDNNIVAWDRLITKLRGHVDLTGECMKVQLILNICETVFALSFGTYLVIRSASGYNGGGNMGYAITMGFYCVVMAARLYVKVAIAESIYTKERLLMKDLKDSELRVRVNSTDALHELRNLQQSLMLAPTKIPIGSFCDLDSKLLVQVIIQTFPMLIAVAQFHDLG